MTITLNLTPDEALRVEHAKSKGINIETMMRGIIAGLPATESNERIEGLHLGQAWAGNDFDAPLTKEFGESTTQSERKGLQTLFAQWAIEDAKLTPEEIAEQDRRDDESLKNLERNRLTFPVPEEV